MGSQGSQFGHKRFSDENLFPMPSPNLSSLPGNVLGYLLPATSRK